MVITDHVVLLKLEGVFYCTRKGVMKSCGCCYLVALGDNNDMWRSNDSDLECTSP